MSTESADVKEFQIGLTMSGAISAGAYTAGVFDFLIQALEEWERARISEAGKIPNHVVRLKVMSGASAGAITAAIGAIALADANQTPEPFDPPQEGKQPLKYFLPKLYQTWVVKPGLVAEGEETSDFLDVTDLKGLPDEKDDFSRTSGVPAQKSLAVASALNSRLLDEIAKAALDVSAIHAPRPYVADPLHIYMTLANLRGVPYTISFTGSDSHYMISHGDRVHYAVAGLGSWSAKSAKSVFADSDQKRAISVDSLVAGDPRWKDFSICSLASAAFPLGLAPRLIRATLATAASPGEFGEEYKDRQFPLESLLAYHGKVNPDWTTGSGPPLTEFRFVTADGGIIDNDPFQYARFALKEDLAQRNEPDLAKADRAVIMVSPFPHRKPIKPEGEPGIDVVSIFKALQPALIDQARFKPDELVLAADPRIGSRYLIGPSRTPETGDPDPKQLRYPIASGLLGGFGGFVARAFRDHDFQLGRRNCQKFLRDIFTVPPEHEIFKSWPEAARANPDFRAAPTKTMQEGYCLIPLLGSAKPPVPAPVWPRITADVFNTLQGRIAKRFDKVAPALVAQNINGLLRYLLQFALLPVPVLNLIREKMLKFVNLSILTDLVRRNQIEGWRLPAATAVDDLELRLVIAELINPDYNLRTIPGLVKATGLAREKVEAALAVGQSAEARGKPFEVWRARWSGAAEGPLFTLASRKPGFVEQISLSRLGSFLPAPKIDPAEA